MKHTIAVLLVAVACASAVAGPCDAGAQQARAANETLRAEVFTTHPKHPFGALALEELKRSDDLIDKACRLDARNREPMMLEAAMATRNARERLAGRLPRSL